MLRRSGFPSRRALFAGMAHCMIIVENGVATIQPHSMKSPKGGAAPA